MKDTICLLVSAPPGAGKDEFAKADFSNIGATIIQTAPADRLKELACISYKTISGDTRSITEIRFCFEQSKNEPQICLNGLTPRQYYILFAEQYVKVFRGKSFFGHEQVKTMRTIRDKSNGTLIFIVTGCGSDPQEELTPIVDSIGPDNVYIVNIFANYPGYNPNIADSRVRFTAEDIGINPDSVFNIQNDRGVSYLHEIARSTIRNIFLKHKRKRG